MKKTFHKIITAKYGWVILTISLIIVNLSASILKIRVDLTKEKRYTLDKATLALAGQLQEPMQINVFLKGDFPSGFRKLANTTRDFLTVLKDRHSSKIRYRFISPLEKIPGTKITWADSLIKMGSIPINLTVQKKSGESTNIIFPVALVSYMNKQRLVNLYPGSSREISQYEIHNAEAIMEYQFAKVMDKLLTDKKPGIAYSVGNGEPVDGRTYDIRLTLQDDYAFGTLNLGMAPRIPKEVDVLMIVKPTRQFSEKDKLKIDQFVMRGGKLLCFIDNLIAEKDSLQFKPETIAFDRNLNLTDLFFRYGLRINTDLVMDLRCDAIPFVVGGNSQNPQIEFLPWNYYPLLSPGSKVVSSPGYVIAHFANSIDTIQVAGVRKEPLLVTSPNSRIISTPALISLNENKDAPQDEKFKRKAIPVAMLLEGQFTSLYKNRLSKAETDTLAAMGEPFRATSAHTQIIVAADGDIVLNDFILPEGPGSQPEPIPMGWNRYTYTEYLKQSAQSRWFVPASNREFLLNCMEYLVSNPALSRIRNKEIVLRLLDGKKVRAQKSTWQFINIILPLMLVIIFGWLYQEVRKRRFAS